MNQEAKTGLDYKSPDWVAQQLGLDKTTVYRYLQAGVLPAIRIGSKWLISEMSLIQFLRGEEVTQTDRRRVTAWASSVIEPRDTPGTSGDFTDEFVDGVADAVFEAWRAHPHTVRPPDVMEFIRRARCHVRACAACDAYPTLAYCVLDKLGRAVEMDGERELCLACDESFVEEVGRSNLEPRPAGKEVPK